MRSLWKSYVTNFSIITQVLKNKKKIQTKLRKIHILPMFVGFTFNIYNGCIYKKILVKKTMIGFKLGDFVFTRKLNKNKSLFIEKKKKKQKKK